MSVDISVSITEDIVDIIATPTVNIVNVTNSASIDPGLYDLSEFTNTSGNPFVRTSGLSSYVPASRTLTINGTTQDLSANRTFTVPTDLTIGTTPIASGTIGRVLFQGTGNVLQQSSSLFWDSTNNRLGIGTSSPSQPLHVVGRVQLDESLYFGSGGATNNQLVINATGTNAGIFSPSYSSGPSNIITFKDFGGVEGMRLTATRNLLVGTTTDAGFKLDVNGTARVSGNLTIATGFQFLFNNTNVGLYRDANTLRLGGFGGIEFLASAAAISSQTIRMKIFDTGNVAINTTTDAGFRLDVNGTARVQNQLSLGATGTAGRLNLARSTDGIMIGAFYTIGTNLVIENGSNSIIFSQGGFERMRIASGGNGNILINTTTDAGFKLDVNGTARVKGTGTTSATTAFSVQDSAGANTFLVRDDGQFGKVTATNFGTFNIAGTSASTSAAIFQNGSSGFSGFRVQLNAQTLIDEAGTNAFVATSAILELKATTKGFLPPRQTQAQRTAIASPAVGLQVYQTDGVEGLYIYKSTGWALLL